VLPRVRASHVPLVSRCSLCKSDTKSHSNIGAASQTKSRFHFQLGMWFILTDVTCYHQGTAIERENKHPNSSPISQSTTVPQCMAADLLPRHAVRLLCRLTVCTYMGRIATHIALDHRSHRLLNTSISLIVSSFLSSVPSVPAVLHWRPSTTPLSKTNQ
jgi:hypothetical protein